MNRKIIFSIFFSIFFFASALIAQLKQGSIAPDWTLTDINKKVWHLYDLTSKGKTVFIDVSATWCGPCWRYHKQRSLDSLYAEHGPKGSIDQSCYVFLIEGDGATNSNDLNGTGKHTVGNWIKGTDFPIIDPGADTINVFMKNYGITYYPTVYMICPDNKIFLVGPGYKNVLFQNIKSGCAPVKKEIQNKKNFNSDEHNYNHAWNEMCFQNMNSETIISRNRFFVRKKRLSISRGEMDSN